MKRNIRFTGFAALVMAAAVLGACGPKEQKNGQGSGAVQQPAGNDAAKHNAVPVPVFENPELGEAYEQYIRLKDALVASDAARAQMAAVGLQAALEGMDGTEKAVQLTSGISESADLEVQRKAFSGLSNAMSGLVKSAGITSGEVYLAYCPMADNDAGAFWLASEREIRNPYFGDKMMKCGTVKETIR